MILKMFLTQKVVMGVVRHGLTTIGGAMVASGYLDASHVEAITGASLTLAGVAFSVWDKRW